MTNIKLFLVHLIKYILIVLSWILKFAIVIPNVIKALQKIEGKLRDKKEINKNL